MKFSEMDEAGWPDLQPYVDTCLIPVTGLLGDEPPWQMADRAAEAGAWLSPLEQAFKGRTMTLPAFHYYDGSESTADKLRALCGRCRTAGFRYVVLISGRPGLLRGDEGADLLVHPQTEAERPESGSIRQGMAALWTNRPAAGGE